MLPLYEHKWIGENKHTQCSSLDFYGTTTGKFEDPNNIIHTQAKKEGKTTAYVQICFEHQNNKYLARRTFENNKISSLKISKLTNSDGKPKLINEPDTFIRSVIPKEMAEYFFFDGEQAENFNEQGITKF